MLLLDDLLDRLPSLRVAPFSLPVVVCCVLLYLAYVCLRKNQYDIFSIPGAPTYAVLGHIPVQLLSNWAREYGPFVRLELGFGQRWILVADPTAAAKVISRGPEAHDKDVSHYKIYSRLSKAPRGSRIRKGFDLVRLKALELADILAQAGPDKTFDADEMGLRLTLDVIGTAGFGHDFKALQTAECPLLDILPQVVDYCEMHDGFSELIPEFFFQLSKVNLTTSFDWKCIMVSQSWSLSPISSSP
ncbi:hypothetical protein WJX73_005992 [Symbiochloris irregularis]|uniref:Cytochrome P450 n=1 Tax=Symbiochloris irregularis TaxID=706552 RepID=A0AAW1PL80_9CHLO